MCELVERSLVYILYTQDHLIITGELYKYLHTLVHTQRPAVTVSHTSALP